MGRPRPWRAVASLRLGPGLPPITLGRASATTREGLARFVEQHAGDAVEVWEVLPVPEVDDLLRDSHPGGTARG